MDSEFLIKWGLSLVVGSAWVTLSSLIAEKIDGKWGGLILGLPSTVAVSILFIGVVHGIDDTVIATTIIPFSSGLYCLFFLTYIYFSKKNFTAGLFYSLIVWFLFAILAAQLSLENFVVSVLLWAVLITVSIFVSNKYLHIDESKIPDQKKPSSLLIKAAVSGVIISIIVLISKFAGPTWGGIFATFPALTLSTFILTVKSGGVEFTRLIAKNILISTTTTIGIYAIVARYAYPIFGLIGGTLVTYLAVLLISIPVYFLVFEKIKS